MISVDEATALILSHTLKLSTEHLPISACVGRVLKEDLVADRDFPPFDRVTMDGIAIDFGAWEKGTRRFKIQETAAAGAPRMSLQEGKHCIEVMTGAILPAGCDTIIRYEDISITKGAAQINLDSITQGQNIHVKGVDRKAGDIIVRSGLQIGAAEIGVAATVGKSTLEVAQLPAVAIVSSGDELVDVDHEPEEHQIRKSNVHQIHAAISLFCHTVDHFHFGDKVEEIEKELNKILDRYDVLILSGGVSAGKFDFVPDALEGSGVVKHFHKVAQRPGKPFWFGTKENGPVVFALPGNPVSSFMCTIRYIIPWLEKSIGIEHQHIYATLVEDFSFKPALTYFVQVKLQHKADGRLYAIPAEGHGSGDLANLVDADAFLELPEGGHLYHKGGNFRVWGFRDK